MVNLSLALTAVLVITLFTIASLPVTLALVGVRSMPLHHPLTSSRAHPTIDVCR